jgi:hypothetical protein
MKEMKILAEVLAKNVPLEKLSLRDLADRIYEAALKHPAYPQAHGPVQNLVCHLRAIAAANDALHKEAK